MITFREERIAKDKCLGKGAFGQVFPYLKNLEKPDDPENQKWAVKILTAQGPDKLIKAIDEIVIGSMCKHDSLIPIRGYHVKPTGCFTLGNYEICLIMPRMKESLTDIVNKKLVEKSTFTEEEIIKYFHSIACGLEYLHEKKFSHRDIKPSNILLDFNGRAKLSDVGLAVSYPDPLESSVVDQAGSPLYMAPEIINLRKNIPKKVLNAADIWSLGVTFLHLCDLELLEVKRPVAIENDAEKTQQRVKELLMRIRTKGLYCSKLFDLLEDMLKYIPTERVSAKDVRIQLEKDFENIIV